MTESLLKYGRRETFRSQATAATAAKSGICGIRKSLTMSASFLFAWSMIAGVLVAQEDSRDWPGSNDSLSQVKEINRLVKEMWTAYEIEPVQPAEDYEWCRRIYLDLLGRIPTVDELQEFTNNKSEDRYEQLVDKLLDHDDYTEEYSRNWTTIWTNLLIGRTGGNNNNSMINRAGMQKYLRDSFARNKPYDRMVSELVTATGNVAPDAESFNGATNFLICLLYTSPSPRDQRGSRMPSSA